MSLAQTRIEFWHSRDVTFGLIQTFADEFNASQDRYQVVPILTGNYLESSIKLVAALNSGQAPVLFEAETTVFSKLYEEGSLRELSVYSNTLSDEDRADFYTSIWNYGVFDGQRFGLPWSTSIPVLYYNQTLFEQLKVEPPTTWEEFEAVASRLTTRNTRGYIDVAAAFIFETLVTTRGGHLISAAGEANFDSQEAIEALSMLKRMARDKTSISRSYAELDQALVDFARTRVLMAIASEAFFPQGERFSVGFEVASVPIPQYQNGVPITGSQLVVLEGSSNEETEAAFAFWKFLMQPEVVARWTTGSYFLPVRKSAVPLLEDWYAENPSHQTGLNELEYAIGQPKAGEYAVWQSYLQEALERSVKTGLDPAEALLNAQQRVEENR